MKLQPRELARAMSFDDDSDLPGTCGDQVKQIRNAVDCKIAERKRARESIIRQGEIGHAERWRRRRR